MQILSEPFTSVEDYDAWAETRPDEEHYEVVDGQPVLSPSPSLQHQLALVNLLVQIREACSSSFLVLPAPLDWVLWEQPRLNIREPDILVVPREALSERRVVKTPLLAVEVLSPSSVERDAIAKRRDYALAGLDHYWIVDPEGLRIMVYRRQRDELRQIAAASVNEELVIEEPFAMTLRPAQLLD
jgi:Uma2 family endonuclease